MIEKPKIAVIGLKGLPAFGGAATVGENIIMQLKNQFEFTVFSTHPYTNLNTGNYKGTKQIVFKGKSKSAINTFIYYLKAMLYCLFFGNFSLVHLHHAESGFITPFLRIRYKVITTFHGIFFNKIDPKFNRFINSFFRISEKLNLNYSDFITSVSFIDTQDIKSKYQKDVIYIPNGIMLPENNVKAQKDYLFFAAARIYEIKGLDILLDAIKLIKLPIKIKIAGDLDQSTSYKSKILLSAKNLDIEFLGLIKDKKELLSHINDAKLFIFPSLFEAMSMMLLEAASCNTPIIASNFVSNKVVFNENEVLFFNNRDPEDLANKIVWALENYKTMETKSMKAYERLKNEYRMDIISNQYANLYNSIL